MPIDDDNVLRARIDRGLGRPMLRECHHDRDLWHRLTARFDTLLREMRPEPMRGPRECIRCFRWSLPSRMLRVAEFELTPPHRQRRMLCRRCWRGELHGTV